MIRRVQFASLLLCIALIHQVAFAKPTLTYADQTVTAMVENRHSDAITALRSLTIREPLQAIYWFNLAQMQAETNQPVEAEQNYRKALGLTKARIVKFEFAKFLLQLNRYSEATSFAQDACGDKLGDGYALLGTIQSKSGLKTQAHTSFQASLKRNPRNAEALDGLIPDLLEARDYDTAQQLLKASQAVFPVSSALYWSGMLEVAKSNSAVAQRHFEKYLTLYPMGRFRELVIEQLKVLNPSQNYDQSSKAAVQAMLKAPVDAFGDNALRKGKRWTYNVSWKFLNLGKMVIEAFDRTEINGTPVWHLKYYITSNPSIPLITLDDVYESYVDVGFRNTHRFRMTAKRGPRYEQKLYEMDYRKSKLIARCTDDDGFFYKVEKDLPIDTYDGNSVLTWARTVVSREKPARAVTVVDENYNYSYILSNFKIENIQVKAGNFTARRFDAEARYEGIAGLTGKGTGWMTTDREALPVKALFEITIGSISLELEKIE